MTSNPALPPHLQQRLRAELKPGESLVWSGQPDPGRYMRDGFKLWLFFIPWTAFSLFWIVAAMGFRVPEIGSWGSAFPLFGLPFLLIGIGGLSAPFWLRRKAHSMVYAVTSQRAIAIEGTRSITVRSYLASDIGDLERTEHADGSGNLVLRSEGYRDSDGDRQTRKHGFFAIAEVRRVETLVDNMRKPPAP